MKKIKVLKTQYKQNSNNDEKSIIIDSIKSFQNEIEQYYDNKYKWEKENDYQYINFGILNSIKSLEKEIEQIDNKKDINFVFIRLDFS